MSQRRYFGTDGIRGQVGSEPITARFMLQLGWAAGRVLASGRRGRVVIGKDTRISGYMFESALEAGLAAAGCDCRLLGPMPTPAIAYLTRTLHASAGIVISASHNPYHDNGIKFFGADGSKLPDATELAIEALLDAPIETIASAQLGRAERVSDAPGRYIEFCKSTFPYGSDLRGLKLVVDCANGATYQVAPSVFRELGAEVEVIGNRPDGLNINVDCGSTAPEALQRHVVASGADLGIALDGDGDRLVMVDHTGALLDGDELLWVIARDWQQQQGIAGVAGTLMSNLGLELALRELGISFSRAKVGDRYVMELLRDKGWLLGGESSGHIICLNRTTTGDGIISALQVIAALRNADRDLYTLKQGMVKLPQQMINVQLQPGFQVLASDAVLAAVCAAESELGDRGRVLLRPSGTEPLVRVMVEGDDATQVARLVAALADEVQSAMRAH